MNLAAYEEGYREGWASVERMGWTQPTYWTPPVRPYETERESMYRRGYEAGVTEALTYYEMGGVA